MGSTAEEIVEVYCECDQVHTFARALEGQVAKCPTLGKRFKVPAVSSPVAFIEESESVSREASAQKDVTEVAPGARLVGSNHVIEVACECGQSHRFAGDCAARVARCPVDGHRFRIPEVSGGAAPLKEGGHKSHPSTPTLEWIRALYRGALLGSV